ncbi:YceG family protein [Ectobacillus panaciterrae]|uniref:YceG family protein n=1 Tax=Ectobacillus panaciterrae TaxID=363872 RepID=UPI00041D9774|nr:YceG family protein [Ectobacillus panaciterrae]
MNIQPIKVDIHQNDWKSLLHAALPHRGQYECNESNLTYIQVTGQFLGCLLDEEEYLEFLFELVHESDVPIHLLSQELDKRIENERLQAIQNIFNIHNVEKGLSAKRFVAFMEGAQLLPLKENQDFYRHFREEYINLLNLFKENHQSLLHPDFRRFIVDTVKWSWNHINNWVNKTDFRHEIPRIVWYGDANKSEAYFLYFLIKLGFDVLLFHPGGKDILSEVDKEVTPIYMYPTTIQVVPFPDMKPIRKSTIAKKATREMEQVLHSDDSLLYKSWQFRSYCTQAITLKTTYDELLLISREKAFIRPNFEVKNNTVYIPNLFAKVLGISLNKKEYWNRVHELAKGDLATVFTSFPFAHSVKGNQQYHYQNALSNGRLDPEKMIKANWWMCKKLPDGLQLGLAAAISRYVEKALIKPLEHENKEQVKLYLFTQAMDLPEEVIRLLQQFDYSQEVPRVMIYNNGNNGEITRSDAALLLLLNEFGVDLLVYNPRAENDIELFIDASLFDCHWLEEVSFNEVYQKETSAFKKEGSMLKQLFHKLLS